MEYEVIRELLEKYWLAETSVEEERTLKVYFRGEGVAPDLEVYRPLFAYFDALHDRRMVPTVAPVRSLYRKGWWYAAAAILIVSLGLYLSKVTTPQKQVTAQADTYQDPAKALAEFKQALMVVSTRMNKGQALTRAHMGRLAKDYKAVTGN
jgi:hypothetical protein